ncbi:unnamed protein product [Rodentolepis nana]|uniref:Nuclear pore complex protein n=1 Tax=Rodentolepis nana TaxID=102285 RepID=A0A0R3TCJ1_RODNA|nr:unnamed protein product [Rodentolepis nana]
MGSPTFATHVFIERLIGIKKSLQVVKSKLYYFCEHIEETHLKDSLRKVFDYIPTLSLAVPERNARADSDLLPGNNSLNQNEGILINQPKKYGIFQPYPISETIIVKKMPLKKKKSDDSSDPKSTNNDKRPIQILIFELDKAIQNLYVVIESLVDTLERHQKSDNMKMIFPIDRVSTKENISFHRGILDHDPYDDREACIGTLLNKSTHWSSDLPKKKDTSEVFTEFYEIWKQVEGDPLASAEKYSQLTNEYLAVLQRPDRGSMFSIKKSNEPSLFDAVDLERSTWQLIHALYSDRICHVDSPLNTQSLKPFCHSEKEIVGHLYDTDSELRETQIIVDWLEGKVREEIVKVAGKYECLFNESTIWENTRHLIENMGVSDMKAKHIISQLFPDAPYIGEGTLAQKDIENENRYLNYLFLCVRGGDLQRAQRICLQRGDITRAVAMEAWRPFHSSYLSEDITHPDNHVVEGNASRVLSKSVAWWSAENPALNVHERAIFAAQSGNLSALLEAVTSGSWEDLLWAHCRALVESRVDASLRSKLDCGPRADTLVSAPSSLSLSTFIHFKWQAF